MLISTKGRYALRFLLDLAMHSEGKPVRVKDVSIRQEISDKYLEQVVATLTKAGFVRSIRGPQGGYLLSHDPSWYTMGKILRLTEGSLSPVACLDDPEQPCRRSDICATLDVWKQLSDAINQVVDHVTLADLVRDQISKTGASL